MSGFCAQNGKYLDDWHHLWQSIADILTTPIGSRVILRDYGSRLFELVDSPLNASGKMAIYRAVVKALDIWEPRFIVKNVTLHHQQSRISLYLVGIYRPTGQWLTLKHLPVGPS